MELYIIVFIPRLISPRAEGNEVKCVTAKHTPNESGCLHVSWECWDVALREPHCPTSAGRGCGQGLWGQARLTSWLLQLMEDDNIMWVIEVLSEDRDFQAIEPICTEDGLILQVCPEHLILWGYRCTGWEA